MNTSIKLPFYARAALFLTGLYVFISMLSITKNIILPLIYGMLVAVIVNPIIVYFTKKKVPRILSIAGVLTISFAILALLIFLLLSQASLLSDALPQLKEKFNELFNGLLAWASNYFNISPVKLTEWVGTAKKEMLNNSNTAITTTISTISSFMSPLLLTPVYAFMMLYYRPLIFVFIIKLFGNDKRVDDIMSETNNIIQSYLVGLFIEFIIISVMNSIGLLILGFEYAILLGVIGALLNIIPYIGGVIAVSIYALIALITMPPVYVAYVIILYTVVQLIDNNYLIPKVVGSKVKLNALVSIITVIAGGALWGIPGMFLSIPVTAVLKVIFDRVEPLKPWGFVLGDGEPKSEG